MINICMRGEIQENWLNKEIKKNSRLREKKSKKNYKGKRKEKKEKLHKQ
jgi:uncharacterized protein YacL (UPF0231 family)